MALDPALYLDLIGTPFAYGGRDPAQSLDCYGLVLVVLGRMGIDAPDPRSPDDQPRIAATLANQLVFWAPCEQRPGAVITFRIGRLVSHCGVVLDDDRFIHCWDASKTVVIERIDEWQHRIAGIYEYVGPAA